MLKATLALIRAGHWAAVTQRISERVGSTCAAYGLRRDLTQPFEVPDAKIPIRIRPLEERDVTSLLGADAPGLSGDEALIRLYQARLVEANLPTCYVAADEDDRACYMQWIIGPEYNRQIQEHFRGIFPVLAPDEALMEAAYTPKFHRGKHIMPAAMARIAEKGLELGVRWAITFVGLDNIPSLKGCKRSGFEPYLLRTDRWRWFQHEILFQPLSEEATAHWQSACPGEPALARQF